MRLLAASLALTFAFSTQAEPTATEAVNSQFGETMTVVRYLVEARVTDSAGRAVSDLPAGEFEVTIGKAHAEVEAADWIASGPARRVPATSTTEPGQTSAIEEDGRLIVFFVQTDFGRDSRRMHGQMRFMSGLADKVVGLLQPEDRIAVVSFDSRIKLRCDFTKDRGAALDAIRRSIEIGKVPEVEPSKGVSLSAALDAAEAKRATRGEAALLAVAHAMRRLEGRKLMFLVGWGFGEMSWGMGGGSRLVLSRAWSEAVDILNRDHAPVITIGTGSGELTLGIALTARATGGLHTSAIAEFPQQTLTRIEGALEGNYELVLRLDTPLSVGEYPISIRTKNRSYRVQATPVIVIEEVDTRYADAIELINAGQVDAGVETLRESMKRTELPVDVLRERLQIFIDAAQWEAALVVLERLQALGAVDDDVARMRDEAERGAMLRRMLGANDRLVEARRLLLDGDEARALVLLDQVTASQPDLAAAWYERGMLLLALGRAPEAEANLKRYLEIEPNGTNAATAREVLASLAR